MVLSGCYDNHSEPSQKESAVEANCTMSQLRGLCKDGECYIVAEERICVGRVTSSDKEGNFYRSIVVEDGSGGMEVKLGEYSLATPYPVGLEVALRLNGVALIVENGVVRMGLPPQNFDSKPREIAPQAVIDNYIVPTASVEPIVPMVRDISALELSLCGRFVRAEGLIHAPLAEDEDITLKEGYHRFLDKDGNLLFLYISPYAEFSDFEIVGSDVALQGILYYESVGEDLGRQFVIRPRFKDDISISNHDS